jgi:glutaredoxin
MIRKLSILATAVATLLAVSAPADAQSAYRWKDKDGTVHYSDQPPPAGNAEVKNLSGNAANPTPSWTQRQAAENFPVVLYTDANCGAVCDSARALLQSRGVPFNEIILGTNDDLKEFNRIFGEGTGVPTATIGSTPLRGFEAGAWNRQLDRAGYPKTGQ